MTTMYRSSAEALEGFFANRAFIGYRKLVLSRATLIRDMKAVPANPSSMTAMSAEVWNQAYRLAERWAESEK